MKNLWLKLAPAAAICVLLGCGGGNSAKVADASGVVTLNGQPVDGARVVFTPKDGGSRFSHGTTDASGNFKLSTFGMNDGALVGRHTVTVTKSALPEEVTKIDPEKMKKGGIVAGMPGYGKMMGAPGETKVEPKNEIPAKYADVKTSTIEVEVTSDGTNDFTLKLE